MNPVAGLCCHPQARAYAESHGIVLPDHLPLRSQPHASDTFQLVAEGQLGLQPLTLGRVKPIVVDFVGGKAGHRLQFGGGRQQDIAKACGLHQTPRLNILDATAGLGRDSFVLASLGATMLAVEKDPILHALLQDGWQRGMASEQPRVTEVLQRFTLQAADALDLKRHQLPLSPDLVYLDPMFPARDKSAKVKADMQALHQWLGAEPSAESESAELLSWALALAPRRVVVKRPRLAPPLAGQAPSHQLSGKANRFDVYAFRRLTD